MGSWRWDISPGCGGRKRWSMFSLKKEARRRASAKNLHIPRRCSRKDETVNSQQEDPWKYSVLSMSSFWNHDSQVRTQHCEIISLAVFSVTKSLGICYSCSKKSNTHCSIQKRCGVTGTGPFLRWNACGCSFRCRDISVLSNVLFDSLQHIFMSPHMSGSEHAQILSSHQWVAKAPIEWLAVFPNLRRYDFFYQKEYCSCNFLIQKSNNSLLMSKYSLKSQNKGSCWKMTCCHCFYLWSIPLSRRLRSAWIDLESFPSSGELRHWDPEAVLGQQHTNTNTNK